MSFRVEVEGPAHGSGAVWSSRAISLHSPYADMIRVSIPDWGRCYPEAIADLGITIFVIYWSRAQPVSDEKVTLVQYIEYMNDLLQLMRRQG